MMVGIHDRAARIIEREGGRVIEWMKVSGVLAIGALLAACASPGYLDRRAEQSAAAQTGDPIAQFELGKSYCCGYGGGYSTVRALDWFCKSALQGYGPAQYELGRIYGDRSDTAYRQSLRQDRIYSYMWYSLAALQEIPLADAERDALANDMTQRELAEARQHVRDWKDRGCR